MGALPDGTGAVHFRVWAPARKSVEVALEAEGGVRQLPLVASSGGYFEGTHKAPIGARYRYRLDGRDSYPDPASRAQPDGPHGPSVIVDPGRFSWTDGEHKGPSSIKGQVLYELHVGTYTKEGTFKALEQQLPALKDLGATCLLLMPLNGFPGRFNWGYDGVNLFAPNATYGTPDELRALVDHAHRLGLSLLVDVVYNHLGPDGNYLWQYARNYFSDSYPKEWGEPLNFDGEQSGPVRDFVLQNVRMWIREYHFDGLRVDATQCLYDRSRRHICQELTDEARRAAGERRVLVIGESEPQSLEALILKEHGGWGMDGIWVDDFHHCARVALTRKHEAYLMDYRGAAQELLSCALRNSLFQGQRYNWQDKPRGGFLMHERPERIVTYLENHDQISNQLPSHGLSQLAGEAKTRAMTTLWLLLPQTPLIFMGQEFFSSFPFFYFCDHPEELQAAVRRGRAGYMKQFPTARRMLEEEGYLLPDGEKAFNASRLDLSERQTHSHALLFHKELLWLRREDAVIREQDPTALAGAVLRD
ncbi:MAG: alpha-amylase family glycosyl hydrolase, partial [Myxococcaceae bacterium]